MTRPPPLLTDLPWFQELTSTVKRRQSAIVEGLAGSFPVFLAGALREASGRPVLCVVADEEAGDEIEEGLHAFRQENIHHFPPWDILPSDSDLLETETMHQRTSVLRALTSRDFALPPIVLASISALMQPTVAPSSLLAGERVCSRGEEIAPEGLTALLSDGGYERVARVEGPQEYCRRGGIIDAWPPFSATPCRFEFFGDVIESISAFDPVSQRSLDPLESCVLVDLSVQTEREASLNRTSSLCDFLSPETLVLLFQPEQIAHIAELYTRMYEETPEKINSYHATCLRLQPHSPIHLSSLREEEWLEEWGREAPALRFDGGVLTLSRLEGTAEHNLLELKELLKAGNFLTLFCHNEASSLRCREVLEVEAPELMSQIHLEIGRINAGFHLPALQWAALSDHEIFRRYHKIRRIKNKPKGGTPLRDFTELKTGDHVVHILHGIGMFQGIERLKLQGQEQDYLAILFAEDAKLYVPLSHIDLVQKYIGGADGAIPLSRLGGKTWSQKKSRAAGAIREAAADLMRLQAARNASPGIAFPADSGWQMQFEEEFIYQETEDQLSAIQAIKADMEAQAPMDRLLCGDVGFGKTEVAIRAAFKAVMSGYQVAVLVPTTILAEQHYRTFHERTADFPVRVECLSRFRSGGLARTIIRDAAAGEVDILIGTHRLLSTDVKFKDLGLVIIDEEQRFGVEHKERLKAMRTEVDVLTMTATPIPRTLHLGLLGLRDISTLTTPPTARQAILTQVVPFREDLIRRAILRELSRGGQIFFVHNRVHNIDLIAGQLAALVPEARIGIGHGQMNEHELEEVMHHFINHRIDILVATTIIESGLDIPNANTIFVNNAGHFGLSELHQLRGRVGRFKNRAFAYFLVPKRLPLSPQARKRLSAIEEFAGLGAGFELAIRDLEIRGAGNIMGMEQSGHILQIGYELYCRLLERVVRELRGEKAIEREPVELELGTCSWIPDDFITLEKERLRTYRDLASCRNAEELDSLQLSLRDRYGELPHALQSLFRDELLRQQAQQVGINYLGRLERALVIGFTPTGLQTHLPALLPYHEKRRKTTPLEGNRYRLGLGTYEEEWKGFHADLAQAAILVMTRATSPDTAKTAR